MQATSRHRAKDLVARQYTYNDLMKLAVETSCAEYWIYVRVVCVNIDLRIILQIKLRGCNM